MKLIKFRLKCTTGDKPWHHFLFPTTLLEIAGEMYNMESWSQFTGLTDSKGVEIYEGDIVDLELDKDKHPDAVHMAGRRMVVWDDREAAFRYADFIPMSWGGHKKRTVVGNIYENPELMK